MVIGVMWCVEWVFRQSHVTGSVVIETETVVIRMRSEFRLGLIIGYLLLLHMRDDKILKNAIKLPYSGNIPPYIHFSGQKNQKGVYFKTGSSVIRVSVHDKQNAEWGRGW